MKKIFIPAALSAAVAIASLSSCGGNKAKQEDSLKEVEEMVAAVKDYTPDTTSFAAYNAEFFNNPAKKAGTPSDSTYVETETGLKYVVITEGTGKTPSATDAVTVHYTGILTDGTEFDSSVSRGEPITFPLNRVIAGWTEGLQQMKEGGVAVFYIPSGLAYGEQGAPGAIPPNSDLIFKVQLFSVD